MKTKKLKQTTTITLLLSLCVVLLGTGCERDKRVWWWFTYLYCLITKIAESDYFSWLLSFKCSKGGYPPQGGEDFPGRYRPSLHRKHGQQPFLLKGSECPRTTNRCNHLYICALAHHLQYRYSLPFTENTENSPFCWRVVSAPGPPTAATTYISAR